jgi:hypothetical protein
MAREPWWHLKADVVIGVLTAAAVLAAGTAAAQAPPTPHTPDQPPANQPDQRACAQPRLPVAPSQKEPGSDARSSTGEAPPLSDQLAKSDGVICPPPGVDPEIRAPAPDVGRMPVIPPPGSPGGDPNVRPK